MITSLEWPIPQRAPCILAGAVFEIDKGTRVLTYSPNAIHKRRQYRRNQLLSICAVTSGSRRQCGHHQLKKRAGSTSLAPFSFSISSIFPRPLRASRAVTRSAVARLRSKRTGRFSNPVCRPAVNSNHEKEKFAREDQQSVRALTDALQSENSL